MKLVLAAGVVAMLLGIVSGPALIAFLRRHEFGQHIREDGPVGHLSKQGTPTMGGVGLLACALLAFGIFTEHTGPGLAVAGTALACAAIGFADDYLKLTRRRSLGLRGRWKLLLLAAVVAGVGMVAHREHLSTDVFIPLVNIHVDLGPGYYVFIFLVVAGAANAVNLTDGLDGLCAGTVTIAALTYAAMMVVAFLAHNGVYPGHTVARRLLRQPTRARPRDHRRGPRRGLCRLPLVQRLPGRRVHGRHRRLRARAAAWRPWRSSPRPRPCSWSSAASS